MILYLYLSKIKNRKDESEVSHNLLYKTFNIKEDDIYKNENGKPYIKNNPFYFSLSHSKGNIAFIKSDNEVGLDIELKREINIDKLKNRVLNKIDLKNITDSYSFLKTWTIKEAYLKYLGVGLTINLKDVIIDYQNNYVSYKSSNKVHFISNTYNDIIYTVVNSCEDIIYEILQ